MSEFESRDAVPADLQFEMLVAEVESKFIAAEDAMSDLRHAVRQLKAYQPAAQQASSATSPAPPAPAPAPQPDAAALQWGLEPKPEEAAQEAPAPARPGLDDETVGVPFWPGPKGAEPEPEVKPRIEDYGMDSTSEASWPIARAAEEEAEAPPTQPEAQMEAEPVAEAAEPAAEPAPAPAAAEADDDARREEVARIVAQMRDSGDEPEEPEEPEEPVEPEDAGAPGEDDEAKRRDVARMVAQMREGATEEAETPVEDVPAAGEDDETRRRDVARMVAEMRDRVSDEPEPSQEESPAAETADEDDEARRQDVARMVAEMRNGGVDTADEEPADAGEDDGARREDVASMVAQMRAEMDSDAASAEEPAAESDAADEDVRDEVRRAVEAARAEMASGYKEADEAEDTEADKRFSFPDWQSTHVEPSGPPVIVIKDSEGRVELARVYETLSLVNCDENAALLNYTPHSVTVGLNATTSVPEVDAMTEAVKTTFGRACEVDSDGVRVNVQIGKDLKGKDSAA
jgi:hypothetical protein